jgi:hypothetical protein
VVQFIPPTKSKPECLVRTLEAILCAEQDTLIEVDGELQFYDPQQHLPMVLAKKDNGRETSDNVSRPVAFNVVTPRGVATYATPAPIRVFLVSNRQRCCGQS